jgi:RNA polymerase sigma factor (sigma-70 family)
MATGSMTRAIKDLRHLVAVQTADDLTDRQLLERFAAQRDEAAFALLVRRHGPMVLGVCRRVLGHLHDAEDAFQAAFLVLARKAHSPRWQDSVGGWLFQVAYHLALRRRADVRRKRMQPLPDAAVPDLSVAAPDGEWLAVLDDELNRLPEKYRVALLLCHYEGKSRAEAARQLGWKEGTVKIRLERGRALLRARLTRRGLEATSLVAGTLAASAASAGVPPTLANTTATAARLFAAGGRSTTTTIPESAASLAEGVLRTMMLTRLKIVAVLLLAVGLVCLGAGFWAQRVLAEKPDAVSFRQESPGDPPLGPPEKPAPEPARKADQPLRVLLFAGAPTREYQFVRALFVNQTEKKKAELSIYLQSGGPRAVQDVPPERMLRKFPTRWDSREKEDAEDRFGNLARYDVLIAFDPDWSELTEEQAKLMEKWVDLQGGGLIVVAGPVGTYHLCPEVADRKLKPLLDLLPVRLKDSREKETTRDTSEPWSLDFPNTEPFLDLDEKSKDPLSGWSEFFFGKKRDDWRKTEDRPLRGFYTAYPVKSVKPGAVVLATFRDAKARIQEGDKLRDLPYLVTAPRGKGKAIFLGSGETWRLRQYREGYSERFWSRMARYAASVDLDEAANPGPRPPELTAKQRKAIEKGLDWLIRNQHKDGHWEAGDGRDPVTLTALAGLALLMQGSTVKEGEYASSLRKAVEWLMAQSQGDGLLGNPNVAPKVEKSFQGHGHALLFLAHVYGDEENRDRREALEKVLTRAIEFTVKAQTAEGGWGYLSRAPARRNDNQAEVIPTVLHIQSLRAARNAGFTVPKAAIDASHAYLVKSVDPSTSTTIPGLSGAFTLGAYNTSVTKTWLGAARKFAPVFDEKVTPTADEYLQRNHFAQVAYQLGEEGHARLLPDSRPRERITWSDFRKRAFDHLLKTQNRDGSWGKEPDQVRATALNLAILQLDLAVLTDRPR